MKKIIKKWGDSNIIVFSKEDMKVYNLKSGDTVDIEIIKIKDKKNVFN